MGLTAKIFHSISLRVPQNYAIRSGLRVFARNRAQNSLFWTIFTSSEYLSFVPFLIKSEIKPVVWIDCGAATGYVTLLFNHLIKAGVLPWKFTEQWCIEPSRANYAVLSENLESNKLPATPVSGLIGRKEGTETFYQSASNPWGSSIQQRFKGSNSFTRSYFDLTPMLTSGKPCMLKVDIEGAEFSFIETYRDSLQNVQGIIIEFHKEMGDCEKADKTLTDAGLNKVSSSLDKANREVCLYLRR